MMVAHKISGCLVCSIKTQLRGNLLPVFQWSFYNHLVFLEKAGMGPLQRNGHISLRAVSPVVSGKCSGASWQSRRKGWGEKGGQTTQCSGARKTKRFYHSKS